MGSPISETGFENRFFIFRVYSCGGLIFKLIFTNWFKTSFLYVDFAPPQILEGFPFYF